MDAPDAAAPAFPYAGPDELRTPIEKVLRRVVDPEVAMSIVDVGLVYGVTVGDDVVRVTMTMTTASCPVTDVIMQDVQDELEHAFGDRYRIEAELVWEPPWTTDRMSARAKAFMGW